MAVASPTADDTVDCDFLIVGAGSSGCVLASRLVRAGLKVLLVEKGPADASTLAKVVGRPSGWVHQASSGEGLSEAFNTVPQAGLGYRELPAYNGVGGGGSSNVNAGLYQRGREEDYEKHWPWELKDIEASFKSIEAELTLEELPTTGTVAPSCARMLEEVGFKSPPRPSSSRSEDGYTEPTWTRLGLGGCPMKRTTTRGGERQTAWSAFVRPVTTMPNLKIKDDAAVSRVIIEGGRAVGVEVVESAPGWWWLGGRRRRTRVRQLRLAKDRAEIVVCCGAFRSPKLLMLSGVGPRRHLEEKGVPVVVDMPHVGENLQDHLILATSNISKTRMTEADYTEDSFHSATYFSCALPQEAAAPAGPPSAATAAATTAAGSSSSRTEAPSPGAAVVGVLHGDGSFLVRNLSGLITMLFVRPGLFGAVGRGVVLAVIWVATWLTPLTRILRGTRCNVMLVTSVKSKGTVRLASGTDAAAPPVIDPGYFSHPQDRRAMLECWRTIRRAKRETTTGRAVFGFELLPGKKFNDCDDDESFLKFAREFCLPYFHPVGTCRMGREVQDSVVSADDLRVHGISGLRVADASVAPHIPATPTQAMCMMIGDRAAAIALRDRFAKEQVKARMIETASSSIN
ncbi:glucose-methanol-choline oxidoreductase [Ectocarpus siliculosus]|uniref:Glucose-methanol-choline oxidoreductase n=1 Tax=Ectocarpus siliculosus TaxID=2880 RepID=D7G2G8_ECTSI|nr:glucose-methanol-choline oxidoreductase [Ectocarpus siliculosus]|eukprot:CBJ33402.1 glucose-methanol-choline oxidoreductase [Ectocarpus siliculosus]